MSTHKGYALMAILAMIAVFGIMPVFAQSPANTNQQNQSQTSASTLSQQILPLGVSTDKGVYDQNSTILVSGNFQNPITGQTVTMTVSDSNGKIVKVDQLLINSYGEFQTTIKTSSPLFTSTGTYTIRVQYGSGQGLTSTTTQFEIQGGGGGVSCLPTQVSATIGNEQHCIDYSIDGGTILKASLSQPSKSLTVNIQANSDGNLTLNIPISVLDAKSNSADNKFVVLVDGEEVQDVQDNPTADTRGITIPFQEGSSKIEIIGTQIVPEFGPIAALVLAIAII
jgi:hypothetical protein